LIVGEPAAVPVTQKGNGAPRDEHIRATL